MFEPAYRLLGALLVVRRGLVAATALGTLGLWLMVLREAGREPTAALLLAAVGVPLLLSFAGWRLFQLPPGVVFRPVVAPADPPPQRTARCRSSAYFEGRRKREWRLDVRSSLAIGDDGSMVLISPPPLRAGPEEARQAFVARGQPTMAQLQAGYRTAHPEWTYLPGALVGSPSRILYESAEEYARTVARAAIPHAALVDVHPGWQYTGPRRLPAIRLSYYDADGRLAAAYLAFSVAAQRAWALAGLVGRRGTPFAAG